jgi:biotin carboxylase
MKSLNNKKLLILGGSAIMRIPVLKAKSMGLYTIVTDWHSLEKSPAKQIADEYWDISLMDYNLLAAKIKEEKIDGILTGFTDKFLLAYQHLCELTGLPCYATKEIFETTLDKSKFKELCIENNVPVVPAYDLETFSSNVISKDNKIIIKPVDNSGSQGIISCDDPNKFQECLDYALSFSDKKQVVIEKYIEMDSFSVSYTIQDGVISMSTINDRIVHKVAGAGAITSGGVYPSKYIDSYLEKIDKKVRKMYERLGVKNGVLFIQGFTNGKEYYFYEMGYRISGGHHFIYTGSQNQTDALEQLIHFAVTGKMADYNIAERDNPRFKNLCLQWNIIGKEGIVAQLEGFDKIRNMPEVISCSLSKQPGDKIGKDGTTAQKLAVLHMVLKDKSQVKDILQYIYSNFKVSDADSESLVLDTRGEAMNYFDFI